MKHPQAELSTFRGRRRLLLAALATSLPGWGLAKADSKAQLVEVWKAPTCGCCGAWVEHMRAAGFTVEVTEVADATSVRKRLGLPDRYGSCHTATIAGFVLEGHVPAAEVKRLLATRPKALGLAVPGMPISAPGMDVPGRKDPYEVLLIGTDGQSRVFAAYPKNSRG